MYSHGVHFDRSFPTEFCPDVDTLYDKVKDYASHKSKGGGGHGCNKSEISQNDAHDTEKDGVAMDGDARAQFCQNTARAIGVFYKHDMRG